MNILWIGYGKMGQPMCTAVAKQGHKVVVLEPGPMQRSAAERNGLELVADVPSAAKDADLIVTSLPNDAACLGVLTGADGVLAACRSDSVLVETSTISVAASRLIADSAQASGVAYLRAPVSGTVGAASTGKLTSFISGPDDALERVRGVIGSYAAKTVAVGSEEQARVMKLAVNLMVNSLMVSLSEAFAFCRKGNVEPGIALDAICNSAIGSPHLRFKADQLLRQDFAPTFTVTQTRKDMKLITEAGRDLGVPLLLGAAVEQIFTASEGSGLADEDYIACSKVISRLSGLST